MVGVQRGLLVLMAAGALALPSQLPVDNAGNGSPVKREGGSPAEAVYQPTEREAYLSADQQNWIRPGLKLTIVGVTDVAAGKKPTVEVYITDSLNQPIDRLGQLTPGVVSPRFTIATWDGLFYTNQIVSGGNPSRDTAGTFQDLETGHFKYTFAAALPATFDPTKPATLFVGANRNMTDTLGKTYYVNVFKDFLPSTGAVATTWGVTTTARCNQCHDPIAPHGGNYREAKTCAICHNPNNFPTPNADGNWYNGQAWFHQIHSENSTTIPVTYPQDIRKCETCHDKTAPMGNTWYTYPTRAACGSCHNTINWVTGANHSAQSLPQADDTACATCHPPQGTDEYDTSIRNAHIVPSDSKQLKGLNVAILTVTNVGPGLKPTVTFKITENSGVPLKPNTTGLTISLLLGGNTTDYYLQPFSESATGAAYDEHGGIATYTFTNAIPADAKGTWTVSAQSRRTVNLVKAVGGTIAYTEGAVNPIFNVAVTGTTVTPRRVVVDLAKCNACHYRLANLFSHGGQRIAIQFCVECHNANGTDAARRPADQNPPESIGFARMIHRIHTGDQLTQDFTIYGFFTPPSPPNPSHFNEVTYPGDRRNCLACHTNAAAYDLPVPTGALNVDTKRDYFTPQGPATAACLGCHDTRDAAAHAYLNTSPFGEACGTCHAAAGEWSPDKVHAR